jgi:large subunit ribosomal protein L15
MQTNQLKRQHKNKKARQIGRAGQRGKTSGRGTKGQNARAGHKKRPEIRDFIKRIPKMRGRGKNLNTSVQSKPVVLNLRDLKVFSTGETVSLATLLTKKLIGKNDLGKGVKILGLGSAPVKISIVGCAVSAGAKKAIEEAGGTVK